MPLVSPTLSLENRLPANHSAPPPSNVSRYNAGPLRSARYWCTVLLRLDKVSLAYGSRPLLDQVSLQLDEGERVALIGRNGEGKSSLLRLLLREIEPDEGVVWIKSGARLGHLAQDISVLTPVPVADWLRAALTESVPDAATHEGWWPSAQRVATVLSRLRIDGLQLPWINSRAVHDGARYWRGRWSAIRRSCCSMSRRIISISRRSNGSSVSARISGAGAVREPRSRLHRSSGNAHRRTRSRPAHRVTRQLRGLPARQGGTIGRGSPARGPVR